MIGWLNGRASVFGTEGYGFESRVGLQFFTINLKSLNFASVQVFYDCASYTCSTYAINKRKTSWWKKKKDTGRVVNPSSFTAATKSITTGMEKTILFQNEKFGFWF